VDSRRRIRVFTIISLISFAIVVLVVSLTSNILLGAAIGLTADIIQIVTFAVWFLQKELDMSKVPESVEIVREIVVREKDENRVTSELISRLVREGVVSEGELFSLIRDKEMMLVFPYAEGLKGKVWELTKGQPLAMLLTEIGFVKVGLRQNLLVSMVDGLPRQLRDVDSMDRFIKERLPKEWKRISEMVKRKYPEDQYKILERWRSLAAFKVSYLLAKSLARDFVVGCLVARGGARISFTAEFQKHIAQRIDRRELKRLLKIRRHKVKEIVSKISIEFLLSEIPRDARELMIINEDEIKKALRVRIITDYGLLDPTIVGKVLASVLPSVSATVIKSFSENIVAESRKCHESLKRLGIELS
jgi:hypothetical protein